MNENFNSSYKQNLQIHANFIDSYILDEKYRLYLEAIAIADSTLMRNFFQDRTRKTYDELVNHIITSYDVNILTIVDSDGIVLFGGNTLPEGYKVTVDLMKHALNGKVVSDIVNFRKNGISISAASPVIIDHKLVGAFMIGDSMKTNQLVDKIKMISSIDMTVFDGNTRISTTIVQDNQRAIGTELEHYDEIIEVVDKQSAYNEDVTILGIPYKAVYWPLRNNNGERVGLLFIGNTQHDATQRIVYSSLICFVASGILSVILCAFCIYFFNGVVNPLHQKSITDNLTGALNRNGLESFFNIAYSRYNGIGSFIIIDLDNFKDVNDTLGHDVGDKVLQRTVRELKRFFRNSDIIGRMGGDEFIIYAPDLSDRKILERKMRELIKLLRYGFNLGGNDTLFVTASIGIAISPKDGYSYKELAHNADLALYDVKKSGRNGFGFFGEGRCY